MRTAKNALCILLRSHDGRVDTSGLSTLMYEVSAMITYWPPTSVYGKPKIKSEIIPFPGNFEETDIDSRKS